MSRDGVAGIICLALSIAGLALIQGLPKSAFVPIGPDFYPRIVLIIMAVLSAMLIASDLWRQRSQAAPAATGAQATTEKRNYRLVAITFTVFTGYVILLYLVGYRLATFIFMAALQVAIEPPRSARRWVMVLIVALVSTAITYLVFDNFLSVLLPRGQWTGW